MKLFQEKIKHAPADSGYTRRGFLRAAALLGTGAPLACVAGKSESQPAPASGVDAALETPDVFDFALSQSSQDVAMAYLLNWADPRYRDSYPGLNKLGDDFLRMLLAKTSNCTNGVGAGDRTELPRGFAEVWANTHDGFFGKDYHAKNLLFRWLHQGVEAQGVISDHGFGYDKVHLLIFPDTSGLAEPWRNVVVSGWKKNDAPDEDGETESLVLDAHGQIARKDVLAVLANHPYTGDRIVEEYRSYLQKVVTTKDNTPATKYYA